MTSLRLNRLTQLDGVLLSSLLPLSFEFISSLSQVNADDWNAVTGSEYPFTRYEFLCALELSGAVGSLNNHDTGWQPHHLLVYQDAQLIAVMPAYLKHHSYGEYVFDHAWADAYHRYGQVYYPKLVSAIPFSPVSGPRICVAGGHDQAVVTNAVCKHIKEHCLREKLSSWHLLFPTESVSKQLSTSLMQRSAVHFQWLNEKFTDFDSFLATFSSRKRKNLKKERQQVVDQGITLEVFTGTAIPAEIWDRFYHFYQMTYAKRSGHGGYLSKTFFQTLAETMPEAIVLVLAKHHDNYIAGALNFRDKDTLYGRYWGCIQEFKHLHFETCYYQGIEFCIREGLKRFDPGVQGEHKIQRGFRPVYTYSNHWIAEPEFRAPIQNFLNEELTAIEAYHTNACEYLPFKNIDINEPS